MRLDKLLPSLMMLAVLGCAGNATAPPRQDGALGSGRLGESQVFESNAWASSVSTELRLLYRFETLESLGFSPDGITYSPPRAHLFISSAPAPTANETGIFEVTLDGELVDHIKVEDLGTGYGLFSVTRATSGPDVNHFFLSEVTWTPTTLVHEYDSNWNWLATFMVTSPNADARPGDGIAFNHITGNLVVCEEVNSELFEVTTTGELVASYSGIPSQGITFNIPTGTYFGVDVAGRLREISVTGEILREYDLTTYGIGQPVGIASGQGKLFVADEVDGLNSGGYVYVFDSPRQRR